MNNGKIQIIDMHMRRISWYSCCVDCFVKILQEISDIDLNYLKQSDIYHLIFLLSKYTKRLRANIIKMESDWEFYENKHK